MKSEPGAKHGGILQGFKTKASLKYDYFDALCAGVDISVGDRMHPARNLEPTAAYACKLLVRPCLAQLLPAGDLVFFQRQFLECLRTTRIRNSVYRSDSGWIHASQAAADHRLQDDQTVVIE